LALADQDEPPPRVVLDVLRIEAARAKLVEIAPCIKAGITPEQMAAVAAAFDGFVRTRDDIWPLGKSPILFWRHRRVQPQIAAGEKLFAELAAQLSSLPASEAAAERLFSVLECLLPAQRRSISFEPCSSCECGRSTTRASGRPARDRTELSFNEIKSKKIERLFFAIFIV
jgi:hypothetical protein